MSRVRFLLAGFCFTLLAAGSAFAGSKDDTLPVIVYTHCTVISEDSVEFRAGIDTRGATAWWWVVWFSTDSGSASPYTYSEHRLLSGDSGTVVEVTAPIGNPSSVVKFMYRVVVSTVEDTIRAGWQYASFACSVTSPRVILPDPPEVGKDSIRLAVRVSTFGHPSTLRFLWGLDEIATLGFSPEIGVNTAGSDTMISYTFTNFTPSTTYYIRAYVRHDSCPQVDGTHPSFATARTLDDSTARGFAVPIGIRLTTLGSHGISWALNFGVHTSATNCFDYALGESWVPPPPPAPTLDIRLVDRNVGPRACLLEGVYNDLREYHDSTQVDTFRIRILGSLDYLPIDLYWPDLSEHFAGPVMLNALIDSVDMMDTTHYRISHPGIGVLVITASGPRPKLQSPNLLIERMQGVQDSTAILSGIVNPNGLTTVAWFEWGTSAGYGTATTHESVGSGFSAVALESEISGLQSELTYHYRLVAANQADTVYGIDQVFQTGAVTSAGDPVIRPDGYALDRNFPNPFNPSTTITYTLPVTARVAVKIFDLHGRDVATLVDAVAQPGQHQVEWNADGLPTGIYFCRYSTGSFVQTMKLLYVR